MSNWWLFVTQICLFIYFSLKLFLFNIYLFISGWIFILFDSYSQTTVSTVHLLLPVKVVKLNGKLLYGHFVPMIHLGWGPPNKISLRAPIWSGAALQTQLTRAHVILEDFEHDTTSLTTRRILPELLKGRLKNIRIWLMQNQQCSEVLILKLDTCPSH